MTEEYIDVLKDRFQYLCEVGEEGPELAELDALRIILRLWDIDEVNGHLV